MFRLCLSYIFIMSLWIPHLFLFIGISKLFSDVRNGASQLKWEFIDALVRSRDTFPSYYLKRCKEHTNQIDFMFQMFNKCYEPECASQMYIYIVEHHRMCLEGTIVNKLSNLTGLSWGKKTTLVAHAVYKPCKKHSLIETIGLF